MMPDAVLELSTRILLEVRFSPSGRRRTLPNNVAPGRGRVSAAILDHATVWAAEQIESDVSPTHVDQLWLGKAPPQ